MRSFVKASLIGLGVAGLGMVLALSPWGAELEERLGLAALFAVRGPIEPPAGVAVVSLDRDSAERLGLPEEIRDWPRSVHARLIERLVEAGATVIVLDLVLSKPGEPAEDRALARAVADAGRVVLFEYLDSVRRTLVEAGAAEPRWLMAERVVGPLPAFADAAIGLAPFPLPKVPSRVSQFWTFLQVAGERPTLPLVALQHHARSVYRPWSALLQEQIPDGLAALPHDPAEIAGAKAWRQLMVAVRRAFRADSAIAERMTERSFTLRRRRDRMRAVAGAERPKDPRNGRGPHPRGPGRIIGCNSVCSGSQPPPSTWWSLEPSAILTPLERLQCRSRRWRVWRKRLGLISLALAILTLCSLPSSEASQ